MTDRELLELAAKACGYWADEYNCVDRIPHLGWNPLTDDGDALRLAVKLGLTFDWVNRAKFPDPFQWATEPVGVTCGPDDVAPYGWITTFFENGDPYTATRRAIVRAAAELGKEST